MSFGRFRRVLFAFCHLGILLEGAKLEKPFPSLVLHRKEELKFDSCELDRYHYILLTRAVVVAQVVVRRTME